MKRSSPASCFVSSLSSGLPLEVRAGSRGGERRGQRASQRPLERLPRGCLGLSQALTSSGSGRLEPHSEESQLGEMQQHARVAQPDLGVRLYPGSFGHQACIPPPPPPHSELSGRVHPPAPPRRAVALAGPCFLGLAPASLLNQHRRTRLGDLRGPALFEGFSV